MRNQSACFITFLAALFIAVPAVATLLIGEIEIVNEIPPQAVTNHGRAAFNMENATFPAIASDPLQNVPELGTWPSTYETGKSGSFENGLANLHRYSGLFADAPQESGRSDNEWWTAGDSDQFSPVRSKTDALSIRLPLYVNGKSVVVRFDAGAELHNSAAMFFIGTGLIGIAGLKRKKYKKRIRRYRKIM